MPLQATSGAATYDAFGGGVAAVPNYIEDVFSTYLYTGTGADQNIVNNIDLSTYGGMVWCKPRPSTTYQDNMLYDTLRGVNNWMMSNTTGPAYTVGGTLTAFNADGFTLGPSVRQNASGVNNVSWTFREKPKFFDVVTYTGNGTTQNIAHNLGSVPGCIIVKEASAAGNDWQVYHRSTTNTCGRLFLNLTNAENANGRANTWGDNTNPVPPTSTVFTVGNTGAVNNNGATFVAYLFAHNAGGFGLTGTDNVISCGSFTTSSGGGDATVDLGYEPQWLLVKSASGTSGWDLMDNMRGMPNYGTYGSATALEANNSNAEGSRNPNCYPTATGFYYARAASTTYIYIAIRRGPMKVPTSGTSVFTPQTRTGTGSAASITGVGFPVDLVIDKPRNADTGSFEDRLRGSTQNLVPSSTGAESTSSSTWDVTSFASMDGIDVGISGNVNINTSGTATVNWFFRRAPSFFDEVCYTGTDSNLTLNHNLGVVPELLIVKARGPTAVGWFVYSAGTTTPNNFYLQLQSTNAQANAGTQVWNNTSTTFLVHSGLGLSYSAYTYVAYLFATCAGVSKVGSYTGTATTLQVDCGFTGGARFVLIKRTDSTGDWYVWDSARGIVSGNDPYLLLNSTAAEVTSTDYIDTYSAGFEISSTAPAAINASGGTFIFLAIA